ncbi:hypothetical protein SB6424_00063 [Klebsiella pasteurii]|nr:hypothetical protein SB6424_00063 [Klebsiella pasteurii]
MVEITHAQQIRLNLLSTLNYDTAAAKVAVEFVQDNYSSSNTAVSPQKLR